MKEITGTKVFAVTSGAFAVIIGVNLTLAFQAVHTFPGLEVKNSYVASQAFDRDRARQHAMGWQIAPAYERGRLSLAITDASGAPVTDAVLTATVGRATHVRSDITVEFVPDALVWSAPADLAPGNWNIRLQATDGQGRAFRQRIPLTVTAHD